jgi:required for meiotic nuclear division protein 1
LSNVFAIEALNLYDTINIKAIRTLLSGKIVDSSPLSLDLQYGENSYLFVYRFGCLVFFNVSSEVKEQEIGRLKAALGNGLAQITTESFQVISGGESAMNVEFEYVEMKRFSLDQLRMICMTVGQSAGVEYFEMQADRMLGETSNFMEDLSHGGVVPLLKPQRLLRIIGSTASTRQHIISNLSVLDPPELTWKSKDLAKLFAEVQENFDIQTRFRTLDRKLTLIQDNIEILADLSSTRRNTLLESLVVILILIELVILLVSAHV